MARARFEGLFRAAAGLRRSAVVGMVHVQALPGIRYCRIRSLVAFTSDYGPALQSTYGRIRNTAVAGFFM